ncbi:MAG: lysostaphin resistance A-like protein [Lachnospiraceae bacterium]
MPEFSKKEIKHNAYKIAVGLIIYHVILLLIVLWDMLSYVFSNYGNADTETLLEEASQGAVSMMIGILIGIIFLSLFLGKNISVSEIFRSDKKMTASSFFRILCIFMGVQFFITIYSSVLELFFNSFGFTIMGDIEQATETSHTVSMFLYASLAAPIAEELIYRGIILERLKKYGKLYAIVLSSFLFAIMHMTITQNEFAFCVGLILGYVAMEYSIKWSVVLHVINNFVLAELMSIFSSGLTEDLLGIIQFSIFFLAFTAGCVILFRHRHSIRAYIEENRTEKNYYRYTFASKALLIYLVYALLTTLMGIQPL